MRSNEVSPDQASSLLRFETHFPTIVRSGDLLYFSVERRLSLSPRSFTLTWAFVELPEEEFRSVRPLP